MDPITFTAIMAAVGTAATALGEHQASSYNAKVAEAQSDYSMQVAANAYTTTQRDADYTMGRLRARRGASGRTASGSALDVLNESFINLQLDALNSKYEGEVQAVGYRNQARMEKYKGKMALVKGAIGLASGQLMGKAVDGLSGGGGQNYAHYNAGREDSTSKWLDY